MLKTAHRTIKDHLQLTEDSKDREKDEEEELEEVKARLFVTTAEN